MSALHIATYFDVAPVVGYLVTVVKPSIIDYPSRYSDSQTPLHIAATNLCLRSARILLSSGANILLKDDRMRTPLDCVPTESDENFSWFERQQPDISLELRSILEEATLIISGESNSTDVECMKTAKVVLSALGLEIGDRIIVGNVKVGTLRYCGMYQSSKNQYSKLLLLLKIKDPLNLQRESGQASNWTNLVAKTMAVSTAYDISSAHHNMEFSLQ